MSRSEQATQRSIGHGDDLVEQGQQLETDLAAAEGEGLDDDDIGFRPAEGVEQSLAAHRLEGRIDRTAFAIDKAGETGIAGCDRRQRDMLEAGRREAVHGHAAGDDRYVEAMP